MTWDETKHDSHPSFGLATFSRVTQGGGGASLFGSEIKHSHYVTFTVHRAERKRHLNMDWLFNLSGKPPVVEFSMSEAQFGALVSSFGSGSGVPVTLTFADGQQIPAPPYAPRMAESVREVEAATERLFSGVANAVKALRGAFDSKAGRIEMAKAIKDVESNVATAAPNARFVANQFTEHVETTVTKAKADIEATATRARLGDSEAVKALFGGDQKEVGDGTAL